jgi:hypothetical protein
MPAPRRHRTRVILDAPSDTAPSPPRSPCCRHLVNFIPGVHQESYSKEALCRNTQQFALHHGRNSPALYVARHAAKAPHRWPVEMPTGGGGGATAA